MGSGNAQDQGDIGEQAIADPENGGPGCATLDIAMMRLIRSLPIPAGSLSWLHDNPGHAPIVPRAVSASEMVIPRIDGISKPLISRL
jgi:hypothetical protein